MNELLQKHGCSNVFTIPEGLKELMSDITREVLREQPEKIFDFIANYLSVLLITREHGIMAVKILDDLCDCRPSVSDHLIQLGFGKEKADLMAQIINDEIASLEPVSGKEKVREYLIVKKILTKVTLDEAMSAQVCQIIRNTYRDYWYRKKMLQDNMKVAPTEPWEVAVEHTLEIYKSTKPSFDELNRATVKIQAAYRGYHIRRNILRQLKPKTTKSGPKQELPGPPLDIAGSREIDLGRVITITTHDEDVQGLFDAESGKSLLLQYDPKKTITHVETDDTRDRDSGKSRSSKIVDTKKKQKFSLQTNASEMVMRTEIEPKFRPIQIVSNTESTTSEKVKQKQSRKSLQRRSMSQEEVRRLRFSFANVPPTVIILDQEPVDDDDQTPKEPTVEEALSFVDEEDAQEIPEDIADDEYGNDTVPTASSVNTTDVEDLVTDIEEEDRQL